MNKTDDKLTINFGELMAGAERFLYSLRNDYDINVRDCNDFDVVFTANCDAQFEFFDPSTGRWFVLSLTSPGSFADTNSIPKTTKQFYHTQSTF